MCPGLQRVGKGAWRLKRWARVGAQVGRAVEAAQASAAEAVTCSLCMDQPYQVVFGCGHQVLPPPSPPPTRPRPPARPSPCVTLRTV